MKLEVTQSLALFRMLVYYVYWCTSLSGRWIPLGELLCHLNLPLALCCPFKQPDVHPHGPQATWVACSDTWYLWRRSRTWPVACHTSSWVLADTDATYYCLLHLLTILQVCFPPCLFQTFSAVAPPRLSYFAREAHAEGPRDQFYFTLSELPAIYLISKWMGGWMFIENTDLKNAFSSPFGVKENRNDVVGRGWHLLKCGKAHEYRPEDSLVGHKASILLVSQFLCITLLLV